MKRSKLRKKTKNKAEQIRQKCVILAKQIVRKIANYTCDYCGHREPNVKTHGSHIFSEGIYRSMSADIDNIFCLCFTHHLGSWNGNEPSWHKNPVEMVEWAKSKYPARYEVLRERSRHTQQADEMFWTKKYEELKEIWEKL